MDSAEGRDKEGTTKCTFTDLPTWDNVPWRDLGTWAHLSATAHIQEFVLVRLQGGPQTRLAVLILSPSAFSRPSRAANLDRGKPSTRRVGVGISDLSLIETNRNEHLPHFEFCFN